MNNSNPRQAPRLHGRETTCKRPRVDSQRSLLPPFSRAEKKPLLLKTNWTPFAPCHPASVRRVTRHDTRPSTSQPCAKFGCGRSADPSASWENINEGFGRDQFPAQSRSGEGLCRTGRGGGASEASLHVNPSLSRTTAAVGSPSRPLLPGLVVYER